ncbi:TonB-dependent receptor [Leptobacterium sp. I13]|uniref:TonB-dependent receptor n=1 Tax=Leptobacterium meishanense TaxID=3128904 RepID=UPI0030EECF05
MKYLFILLALLITTASLAQEQGSIVGKITDKELNDDPLPFANILIKGTTKGTTTDFDGLYQIGNIAPGTYIVVISFIGYQTLEIPNVEVVAGKVTEINAGLSQDAQALDEVVITTTVRKESQIALLLEQKNAATIQTKIGSEELSIRGISDVATGLSKASGVATQSNKLYVRGLGDRYNNAYLNGFPLPSLNPKQKLITLDIFPTNIVENLGIFKTYSPLLYGDYAGASVDINTKENPGAGFLQIGLSTGANSNATFGDFFLLNGGKYDFFGIDDGARRIPSIVKAFQRIPDLSYDSRLIPIYQFDTSFNPEERFNNLPNIGLSISGGKRFNFKNEDQLDLLFSLAFSSERNATEDGFETVRNADGEIFRSSLEGFYERYTYKTNATALGSLTYRFDPNNTLSFTTLWVNDTQDELREIAGEPGELDELILSIRRGTYQQNSLITNQLKGQHKFNDRKYVLNWGTAYNYTLGNIPDRRQLFFTELANGDVVFGNIGNPDAGNNQRFWQELTEHDISTNVSLDINFDKDEDGLYKSKLTIGSNVRDKRRNFEANQLNIIFDQLENVPVDINNPDALLNQENFENETYHVLEFQRPQNTYKADFDNYAGFADLQWATSDKFTLLAGIRVEEFTQNIFFRPEGSISLDFLKGTIDETFVLPSLGFKYALSETSNLRFAASKTVTLPLFTETAPFLDEDVFEVTIGNPGLVNSDNYNVDIKYEIFPEAGELIAFTAFAKYLDKPIEKVRTSSANNNNSFINSEDATIFGIEFEYRQKLSKWFGGGEDTGWDNWTFGVNATGMITEVSIDSNTTIDFDLGGSSEPVSIVPTNTKRKLQGASPYIVNADINYAKEFGNHKISSTLDFNFFGDRIYAAGGNTIGDVFEKGFGTLNFNFQDSIGDHWEVSIKGKNLLNPTIERYQDQEDLNREFTVSSFKLGMDFSLGLTYKF